MVRQVLEQLADARCRHAHRGVRRAVVHPRACRRRRRGSIHTGTRRRGRRPSARRSSADRRPIRCRARSRAWGRRGRAEPDRAGRSIRTRSSAPRGSRAAIPGRSGAAEAPARSCRRPTMRPCAREAGSASRPSGGGPGSRTARRGPRARTPWPPGDGSIPTARRTSAGTAPRPCPRATGSRRGFRTSGSRPSSPGRRAAHRARSPCRRSGSRRRVRVIRGSSTPHCSSKQPSPGLIARSMSIRQSVNPSSLVATTSRESPVRSSTRMRSSVWPSNDTAAGLNAAFTMRGNAAGLMMGLPSNRREQLSGVDLVDHGSSLRLTQSALFHSDGRDTGDTRHRGLSSRAGMQQPETFSPLVTRLSHRPVVEARAVPGYDPIFNAGLLVHEGTYHLFARGVRDGYHPNPGEGPRFLDYVSDILVFTRPTASTTRSATCSRPRARTATTCSRTRASRSSAAAATCRS